MKKTGNLIVCPNCKGLGKTFDHVFGIFTLGLGYLIQKSDPSEMDKCEICNGKGVIET